MKSFVAVLVMCVGLGACATPVAEDWDKLVADIEAMPGEVKAAVGAWAVDEGIRNYLSSRGDDVGEVSCLYFDDDGNDVTQEYFSIWMSPPRPASWTLGVSVAKMLECMAGGLDYASCGKQFARGHEGRVNDGPNGKTINKRCDMTWKSGRSPAEVTAQVTGHSVREILASDGSTQVEIIGGVEGAVIAYAARDTLVDAAFIATWMLAAKSMPPVWARLSTIMRCVHSADHGCPDAPDHPRDNDDPDPNGPVIETWPSDSDSK